MDGHRFERTTSEQQTSRQPRSALPAGNWRLLQSNKTPSPARRLHLFRRGRQGCHGTQTHRFTANFGQPGTKMGLASRSAAIPAQSSAFTGSFRTRRNRSNGAVDHEGSSFLQDKYDVTSPGHINALSVCWWTHQDCTVWCVVACGGRLVLTHEWHTAWPHQLNERF